MLTTADKTWLRKTVRKIVQEELYEVLAEQVKQIGGYDGATPVAEDDDADARRAPGGGLRSIGF